MSEKLGIKVNSLIKNPRIIILIIFLLISLLGINFTLFNQDAIVINGVSPNSLAQKSGINFDSNQGIRNYEEIISINGQDVKTSEEYYSLIENQKKITIITNENKEGYVINSNNNSNLGISVTKKSSSNIHLGLEFEGGTQFIVKPQEKLSEQEYTLLKDTLQSRLDIYGVSGTKVEKIKDPFIDDQLLIIESTSSNKNSILDLIEKQGNFYAKFGNDTVFTGDNVLQVKTDPRHSIFRGCTGDEDNTFTCSHSLSFSIDQEAVDTFYDIAKNLTIIEDHLETPITYYLDDKEIISLNASTVFKHKKVNNHQITFPGNKADTKDIAMQNAQDENKLLVTILSTKSLPSKIDIVQSYSISSSLGQQFLENAILVGFLALLVVAITIAVRYFNFTVFFGIIVALFSEIIILLGVSVFMKISINLAAIGGIIAAIGTGVDDQVIITDEQFRKKNKHLSTKKRLKVALAIIFVAYITTLAAMFPLLIGGLSMLKGFSFMIIIGVTIGVFLTRPAYASYLRIMNTTKEEREDEEKNN